MNSNMLMNIDPAFIPYAYLVIALFLGCAIGLERSFAGKRAGVRTFGLVSMGSCLFILIAESVIPGYSNFDLDPLRVAAGVVSGVGFLCAGVIIFKESKLSGLTTAAGLWVSAAIGMAVGYGLVALSVFATVATLLVFTLFWFIEHKVLRLNND